MSTEVKKIIPVTLDLGNVCLFDINPLEDDRMNIYAAAASGSSKSVEVAREDREKYLTALTRENTQLLFNSLYALAPIDTFDTGRFIELPKGFTCVPREKSIPSAKAPTRWEKFAKAKGIHKQKRSAKVFDEASGEWKYRHGAKSAKNDPMADWCEEVEDGQ